MSKSLNLSRMKARRDRADYRAKKEAKRRAREEAVRRARFDLAMSIANTGAWREIARMERAKAQRPTFWEQVARAFGF